MARQRTNPQNTRHSVNSVARAKKRPKPLFLLYLLAAQTHLLSCSTPKPNRIFLSYASQDLATAWNVYNHLTALGYPLWFDKKDLRQGHDWTEGITKGIKSCTLILVLVSKASNTNQNVRNKVNLASQRRWRKTFRKIQTHLGKSLQPRNKPNQFIINKSWNIYNIQINPCLRGSWRRFVWLGYPFWSSH